MKITRPLIKLLIQGCINSYSGEYGKVKKIFDIVNKYEVDNVELTFCQKNNQQDILYIIFRGTDEKKDWQQNFLFGKLHVPYDGVNKRIKTHKGFTEDYKKVRDKILKTCKTFKTIIVSGHSKGGAETILASLDINFNYPNKEIISIPIASPRVGNKAFSKSYNKRINKSIRIVNGEDYITKVPQVIFGYRHVNKKLHIGLYNPGCWIPFIRSIGSLYHYPEKYLKKFNKLSDKKLNKILNSI